MKTIRGLIVALVTATVAALVALAVAPGSVTTSIGGQSVSVIVLSAGLSFAVNWLVFIPSAMARTEKFYDFTGSLTYLSMVGLAVFLSLPLDPRAVFAGAAVSLWAVRLGTFLFSRIQRDGEDRRFAQIKTNPMRFLAAWSIQALWCFLTAVAALAIISSKRAVEPDIFFVIGGAMWAAGFLIEVIADGQKSAFRKIPENRDRFITSGLWSWSQHPNYFGEMLLWAGIAVMALPVLSGTAYAALISPFFVALLLLRVSGIPLLDRHALQKWGEDPAYQDYRRRTSKVIPRPPKQPA
ncbi:MAG: DUF1295 domain-containing protein [Pseudomonadota bacterium]